ncbi:hypothetical protein Tco_0506529 [Tanacetum coccineum]
MLTLTFLDTHNMVAFLEKPAESDGFHEIIDFLNANQTHYALTVNPTIYTPCIEQFWATAKIKTVNEERQIQALVARSRKRNSIGELAGKRLTAVPHLVIPMLMYQNEVFVPTHSIDPLLSGVDRLNSQIGWICDTKLLREVPVGVTRRVEYSDNESLGAQEDAFNQGRSIEDIDKDAEVSLVDETQGRSDDAEMFDTDALIGNEVFAENDMIEKDQDVIPKEVSTAAPSTTAVSPPVITEVEITLAQTLAKLKSAKSKVVIQEPFSTSTPQLHLQNFQSKRHYIFRDAVKEQQELQHHAMKNNGIKLLVMKKWLERNPFEAQIQAELIEEERLARKKEEEANIALIESWDNTQAMMEADFELAQRLQAEEQGEITIEERSRLQEGRKYVEKKAEGSRKKSIDEHEEDDKAEVKKHMEVVQDDEEIAIFRSRYSSMIRMLQNISREDLETLWKLVKTKHGNTRPEDVYEKVTRLSTMIVEALTCTQDLVRKSRTRINWDDAEDLIKDDEIVKDKLENLTETDKEKQTVEIKTVLVILIEDDKETDEHEEAEEDDEAEMKKHMEVVQDDEEIAIDAIPLATKPPIIVEYKIVKEGQKGFYHLIRADGSSNRYSSMIRMLQNISREDLETLWKLVKTKHGNTRPEDDYEKVFWGDLKVMFEPDIKSEIWRSLQGYKVTVWKLFDSSGVHFVRFKNLHIFMLVEKRYPLTPITITNMLNKKLQADYWNEMCYQLLKLMIQKMNIKFRGGLLGLKDFKMILRVTTAQSYGCAAIAHCVFDFLIAEAKPAPEQVKNNQITYMERGKEVVLERE